MSGVTIRTKFSSGDIDRLVGVHAMLAGDARPPNAAAADAALREEVRGFAEDNRVYPHHPALKWRYAWRMVAANRPAGDSRTWRGARDGVVNSLIVLSALLHNAEMGRDGIVGQDDSVGMGAALEQLKARRHMLHALSSRPDTATLSAPFYMGAAKYLGGFKFGRSWKRMTSDFIAEMTRLLDDIVDLSGFLVWMGASSPHVMVYGAGLDDIPLCVHPYAFSVQRFLDDVFAIAHRAGDANNPVVLKMTWNASPGRIMVETPGDGRFFNLLRRESELVAWLNDAHADWSIERGDDGIERFVVPLRGDMIEWHAPAMPTTQAFASFLAHETGGHLPHGVSVMMQSPSFMPVAGALVPPVPSASLSR